MGGGGGFFSVPPDEPTTNERSRTGLDGSGGSTSAKTVNVPAAKGHLAQPGSTGEPGSPAAANGGGGGRVGTAMGGIGGMPADVGHSLRFTLDDLIEAITTAVEPSSWDEHGGQASIFPLGGMLLINQTAEVHTQIGDLLELLRSQGAALRSVTIEAHWLLVTNEELREIVPEGEGRVGASINDASLLKLVESQKAFRAQVTCFDGQTVHVMSGNLKSMVTSMIPVVGQLESSEVEQLAADRPSGMAQILSAIGGRTTADIQPVQIVSPQRSVGYQPVVTSVNMGSLLQVTPTLIDDSIVLDLQSVVVGGSSEDKPVEVKGLMSLDRIDVVTQQLMTTLRAPLGRPVLAGGMTLQPIPAGSAHQLYLVVKASLPDEKGEKRAEAPKARKPAAQ
jgi:hypothetical protein